MSNSDNGKRRVNPALLLGGNDSGAKQEELIETGGFVAPRKVRSFLPSEGSNGSGGDVQDELLTRGAHQVKESGGFAPEREAVVPVVEKESGEVKGEGSRKVNPLLDVSDEVELPTLSDNVVSGEKKVSEGSSGVSMPGWLGEGDDEVDLDSLPTPGGEFVSDEPVEVAEKVVPVFDKPVPRKVNPLLDVSDEVELPEVDEGEVKKSVNPLFADVPAKTDKPRPRKVNPLFADPGVVEKKPDEVKPVAPRKVNPLFADPAEVKGEDKKQVNPLFMLGKEQVKDPVTKPDVLGRGPGAGGRARVVPGVEGEVDKGASEAVDVRRKLFVERDGAKPRGPYTRRPEAGVEAGEWEENDKGVSAGLGGEVDRGVKKANVKGFHFTDRDALILRFLARYRYAYVDQIARLVDSTPRNITARLRVLEKRGLIRRESVTGNQYLWTTRKAGNLLVDIGFKEIKKGNISFVTIAHSIGLGNLGAEFEREAGGLDLLGEGKGVENWVQPKNRWRMGIWGNPEGKTFGEMTVTEREIRQGQTRWRGNRDTAEMRRMVDIAVANPNGPELEEGNEGLFVVYGMEGGEHIPDFVIARDRNSQGGVENIAIELELTEKTNAEWRKIIRNYRDNGHMFKKVYYFTHKKSIANALLKVIELEGMQDRVVIRKYQPNNSRMPFFG